MKILGIMTMLYENFWNCGEFVKMSGVSSPNPEGIDHSPITESGFSELQPRNVCLFSMSTQSQKSIAQKAHQEVTQSAAN